ncbi:MAG: hypothetical protein N4A45_10400 [Flavobacteriales bacterium]|jgi:hypothetical protein|nr:hypothetical protein [Flavobacteriales bacterium]
MLIGTTHKKDFWGELPEDYLDDVYKRMSKNLILKAMEEGLINTNYTVEKESNYPFRPTIVTFEVKAHVLKDDDMKQAFRKLDLLSMNFPDANFLINDIKELLRN